MRREYTITFFVASCTGLLTSDDCWSGGVCVRARVMTSGVSPCLMMYCFVSPFVYTSNDRACEK